MADWERDGGAGATAPPQRLGALLAAARAGASLSLPEIAERSNGTLTVDELAELEAGRRTLSPGELRRLTALYGIDPGNLVPARSRLVVDLRGGVLRAGDEEVDLDGSTGRSTDEPVVLREYLALVYRMRAADPTEPVALRTADLEVLATALHRPPLEIADSLRALMGQVGDLAGRRRLRRVLIVGLALMTAGFLLLLYAAGNDDEDPAGAPTPAVVTTGSSTAVSSTAVSSTAVSSTAVSSTATPSTAVPSTAVPSTAATSSALPPQPTAVINPEAAVVERPTP